MGKPIADRGQYPFNVGGILTNGAKYNDDIYVKSLYIYKQRSYNIYDLIDDGGYVYEFMELVYRNEEGFIMDYYDIDINLSQSLKNGTFYIKEQDPERNIYGFSTLYQYNKIKIHDGNYIFRKSDGIDYSLLAVKLTPNDIVLKVGQTMTIHSSYIPLDYQQNNGSWVFTNDSCVTTNSSDEEGNLVVTGAKVGFTVASFTPKDNDTLTAHALIRVVEDDVKLNSIVGVVDDERTYPGYMLGEEFTLQLITEPYNFDLPEPDISGIDSEYFDLINISEDKKRFTFKVISDRDAVPYDDSKALRFSPPEIKFTVDGIVYTVSQYTFYVKVVTKTLVPKFTIEGKKDTVYDTDYTYKATFDRNKYYYVSDPQKPLEWKIFTQSSIPSGVITQDPTDDLTATYHTPLPPNAWREIGVMYNGVKSNITVWFTEHLANSVYLDPLNVTVLHPGDTLQLEPVFDPVDYPRDSNYFVVGVFEDIYKDFYTLSRDGLITVKDDIARNIELRPEYIMKNATTTGNSSIVKYIALMKTVVDPTSLVIQKFGRQFLKIGNTARYQVNLYPQVNSFRHVSYEFSDPSLVSIDEKLVDFSLNSGWGNVGYNSFLTFTAIKGGTTTIKVWCTERPEFSDTVTVTFY